MDNKIKILGISGSLRHDSLNSSALRAAQELAPEHIEISLADLHNIPVYDQDQRDQAVPTAVQTLSEQIQSADALLFATPEYNYSIPGGLKNAIDWISRQDPQPMAGKPAAVMSASMGLLGGARAQYDLRRVLIYLDVHFLNKPEVMIGQAHQRFEAGKLQDESTAQHIKALVDALAAWTQTLRDVKGEAA